MTVAQLDWNELLMGIVRVRINEFSYWLTAAIFREKDIDLLEANSLDFESDKITILVGDGIAVGDVRCVGGNLETIDVLRERNCNMRSVLLKCRMYPDIQHQNRAVALRMEGNFLIAHTELCDARASVNVFIEPLKAAQWLSQTLEGKQLLPQSLLCFLARETGQQALPEIVQPSLTSEEPQGQTRKEGNTILNPGGSNPDTPRIEATKLAAQTLKANLNPHLDQNGKIDIPKFCLLVSESMEANGVSNLFHPSACTTWARNNLMDFKLKRGEKLKPA